MPKKSPIPVIRGPKDTSDFHDSRLLSLAFDPVADTLAVLLSSPRLSGGENRWLVELGGVLRIDFESTGTGEPNHDGSLPEVYEVYDLRPSSETERWSKRLPLMGVESPVVHEIVFASSTHRGWGEHDNLEGIRVICRRVRVSPR